MAPRRARSRATLARNGDAKSRRVLLATIGAPHGLRGEVRLAAHGEDPAGLAAYGDLETEGGRALAIRSMRFVKSGVVIARIAGIETREQAEALKGLDLFVARDRLPETGTDEFYLADLIGLQAVTESGDTIGHIVAVQNYGAGDLLEIAPVDRDAGELLPFTADFVPEVDVSGRRVVVRLPTGILERETGRDDRNRPGLLPLEAGSKRPIWGGDH